MRTKNRPRVASLQRDAMIQGGGNFIEKQPVSFKTKTMTSIFKENSEAIFFSNINEKPEAILHTKMDISNDWMDWKISSIQKILEPALIWEGSDLPVLISVVGAASGRLRELRDPCVFQDVDGQVYLLYSAAGESAIGLVKLNDI